MPIQELQRLKDEGKKSLNIKDLDTDLIYFNIPGVKKRVYFDYNGEEFIKKLYDMCCYYWKVKDVNIVWEE